MIILETLFIIIVGCILHFLYEWCKEKNWMKWFVATNESIFEHIKIAIVPMFLSMIIDYWLVGSYPNYFLAKFLAMAFIWIMMPALFYAFKRILGRAVLWVDISCFILEIIWAELVFEAIICLPAQGLEILGGIGLIVILASTVAWSYFPPKLGLFIDPRTLRAKNQERSRRKSAAKK